MITWSAFPLFAIASLALWGTGAVAALICKRGHSRAMVWTTTLGVLVYLAFVLGLWVSLERPPLRTLGETRLWYSLFMIVSGLGVYLRWHYRWLPSFSTIVAAVFIIINMLKPEIHDKSLMPALQSAWFVPHVTVYMFSYSLFGCAFVLSVIGLWKKTRAYLTTTDNLVGIGMTFLSFGMLSGCIWAKQAWGTYWSWDPKETWAAATWAVYLIYIHQRYSDPKLLWQPYVWLIVGFLLLQMCWYGVNYLPTASSSLHSY